MRSERYHVVYYRWFIFFWFPFTIRKSFVDESEAIRTARSTQCPYQVYDSKGRVIDKRDKPHD